MKKIIVVRNYFFNVTPKDFQVMSNFLEMFPRMYLRDISNASQNCTEPLSNKIRLCMTLRSLTIYKQIFFEINTNKTQIFCQPLFNCETKSACVA